MAACENQGKQHELSDHWKSIKTFLEKKKKKKKGREKKKKKIIKKKKKKKNGMMKKDKKIDWNTNFNKRFYILQNQI